MLLPYTLTYKPPTGKMTPLFKKVLMVFFSKEKSSVIEIIYILH